MINSRYRFSFITLFALNLCSTALPFILVSPNEKHEIEINGETYVSENFASRDGNIPSIVVLHYTATNKIDRAADTLTSKQTQVSAHYLIPDYVRSQLLVPPYFVINLVDEKESAWHAGISQHRGKFIPHHKSGNKTINPISIGIEIMNYGYTRNGETPIVNDKGQLQFDPFFMNQITEALIPLCQDLKKRWDIKPWNFVGHSDVALQPAASANTSLRKVDPGAAFPWERLAHAGIGMWPGINKQQIDYEHPKDFDIVWTKKALERVGYYIEDTSAELDMTTLMALNAFRLHYQPDAFDYAYGKKEKHEWNHQEDLLTQVILWDLITQYAIPPVHSSIFESK